MILGLICLWLGTVGALHHDDIFGFGASSHSYASLGQATPPAHHGPCTACEWEQTVGTGQTVHVAVVTVPWVYRLALPAHAADALILRHFDYTSLRAPPSA